MTPVVVALIPLRGGSKSIPRKNINLFAGKPLCYWALKAAHDCPSISEVWVSTDDDEISSTVEDLGLGTKIIDRPPDLATDSSSTEDVQIHFLKNVPCDVLVTLQATSPLVNSENLENAFSDYFSGHYDSMLSGVLQKRFIWNTEGKPLNYVPKTRPRRQDFDGIVVENGAFYISNSKMLLNSNCRLHGNIGIFKMPEETYVEIDEPEDWEIAENLMIKTDYFINQKLIEQLKFIVCDVDGTLTDGGMYYSKDGEALKKFHTQDAKGLEILKGRGIDTVILTSETSPSVKKRVEKLKIAHYYPGISNKLEFLKDFLNQHKIKFENLAYIGDDLNDLEPIRACGFTACPSDAQNQIKLNCNYISKHRGGQGAVREFCDLIINQLNRS